VQTPFPFPPLNKEISNGSRYPHPLKIEKKKKKIEKTKKKKKEKEKQIFLFRRGYIFKYLWHIHCNFNPGGSQYFVEPFT